MSLIDYWHLHLLLILIFFIIFTIHAERLHSVTTWIVFRRLRSLNSFITRRLIISKISLLSRSNFVSILFNLRTKTWNMILFLFLFNENGFLVYLLDCLLVIIIHLCLFLRSIFFRVLIAIIFIFRVTNLILIILIHLTHIIILFMIKLVVHVSLLFLINIIIFSFVEILLLFKMLGPHLAVWSLWTYWKMRSVFWRREISFHLRIILFSLLILILTVKVLPSFK